jgi:hypothetical protein
LHGVVGEQELVAGGCEGRVGPPVGAERGAFAPREGAHRSPVRLSRIFFDPAVSRAKRFVR